MANETFTAIQSTVATPGFDTDGDGVIDPGEIVTTTVTITNNSTTPTPVNATGVQFTEDLQGMTLVNQAGDDINASPIAFDDSYTAAGNVPFTGVGMLNNDAEPLGPEGLALNAGTAIQNTGVAFATTQGGSVTLNANGTFTYISAVGFEGVDTFTYTLRDTGLDAVAGNADDLSGTGTVSITVGPSVWFIDNTAAPGGNGTQASPFNSIAAFNLAQGTANGPDAGDFIYLRFGTGTYSEANGINLANGQTLVGQGQNLVVNGVTIEVGSAGLTPTIQVTGADEGVLLAQNNTLSGFNISTTNAAADGIEDGGGTVGTLTVSNVSIAGTGQAVDIDQGGTLNVTLASVTSTGSSEQGIQLANVAGSFTASTVSLNGMTGDGIDLDNNSATVAINGGTIGNSNDPGGIGVDINAGSASVTIAASVTKTTAGDIVEVTGRTGGTITLSGNLSATGAVSNGIDVNGNTGGIINFSGATQTLTTGANTAVNLASNTGATINFNPAGGGNGLDITTTTGTGFNATGGGTVAVQGSGNTITSTSATALNVANTTIGAADLTFQSISAGNNTAAADPVSGIVLNNTGASGGLIVTGDGTTNVNGSGGVIQNSTGAGISLTSTRDVSLDQMNVTGSGDDGIFGSNVTNFTLNRSNVNNNGNSTADEGIQFGEFSDNTVGVTGTVQILASSVSGNAHNNVHFRNTSGTIDNLTVTGSTFNDVNDVTGANSFLFEASGTSTITEAFITGSTFSNNSPQRALEVQSHDTATISDFVVSGNIFTNNGIHASFTQDTASNLEFYFINNGTVATPMTGSILQAVNVFSSSQSTGGTIVGTIQGNQIGTTQAGGISAVIQGQTDATLLIDNNTITGTNGDSRAISVAFRGPAPPLATTLGPNTVVSDVTITNNTVTPGAAPSGFPLGTIVVEADNQSGADNKSPTVNADIRGNIVPTTPVFDLLSSHIIFYEYDAAGAHGIGQLVDTAPASANATAQLSSTNTGSVDSFGIALIAGPINLPPPVPTPLLAASGGVEAVAPTDSTPPADSTPPIVVTPPVGGEPPVASPTAAPATTPIVDDGLLTQAELDYLVDAAIARWSEAGLTQAQIDALEAMNFGVADMAGLNLGAFAPTQITLDADAAGRGWYLDATPGDDAEFGAVFAATRMQTTPTGAPAGHYDLLTALMHEMGHTLGLEDRYEGTARDALMYGWLFTGERRLPGDGDADGAVAGAITSEEFLGAPIDIGVLPAGKQVVIQWQATIDPQTNQLIVNPVNTGTVSATNAVGFPDQNTNTVTTTLDTLILGGTIWNDNGAGGGIAANGIKDGTEPGVSGVTLSLFVDANDDNVPDSPGSPLVTGVLTNGSGDYSFTGLAPGNYIVRVDAGNFTGVGALAGLPLSPTTVPEPPDPDTGDPDVDNDDNGSRAAGQPAFSAAITLAYNTEPTVGTGNDTNTTLDFGFINNPTADLSVTKTVSDATPNVGDQITFTVTLSNQGPDAATGVEVTDLLPAGLTFVSATPSQGTYNNVSGVWTVGTVSALVSQTLSITALVVSPAAQTNTGTINDADQFDPNAANNTASATEAPQQADLSVTKTVSDATPNVGDQITFTVTLSNQGADTATGVQVTDLLPAGLTFVSATPSQGTYNNVSGVWTVGSVSSGVPQTLSITALVVSPAAQTNTGTISVADQFDPITANNTASATEAPQQADLSVTKTVSDATPNVGDQITFTVTLSNQGADAATGVQVTDLLPAGVSFVSANPSQGTYDSTTGLWDVGALANGAQTVLTITATVVSPAAQTNTGTISDADQFDPNTANNTAGATETPQQADVMVAKQVSNPTPNVGDQIVYTITVFNAGPNAATGVQVTDLLPAGVSFVSANPSQGSYDNGTGSWDVGAITTATPATLAITVTVVNVAQATNTATITDADQFDPNTGNNTDTADMDPLAADLLLIKSVSDATPNVGDQITFSVTVVNNGSNAATGVQVTDLLPAGVSFVSANPGQGTYDSTTGLWDVGALANGAQTVLTITATVVSPVAQTNTGTISDADQVDPNAANNTASATEMPQQADLSVSKTVSDATPNVGDQITFTVTLSNQGADTATGVQVTDLLPAGLTFVSATPSQGTYNNVSGVWTVGTVSSGVPQTLSITALVVSPAAQTNTGTISDADQFDPTTANNTASATVIAAPDMPGVAQNDAFTTAENAVLNGVSNVFADNGSGPDSDPDDPLQVTAVNGNALSVGTTITLASGALLTLNANGTFSYDPNGAFDALPTLASGASNTPGTDSFTYTITGSSTATVTVTITGVDSDDTLIGTAGIDNLSGGIGNDLYFVGNSGDGVNEAVGAGYDIVAASVDYTIPANVEALYIIGAGLTGTGSGDANTLLSTGGANILVGLAGDDLYYVNNSGDTVTETGGAGYDTVVATVGYTLPTNVEAMYVIGAGLTGTGSGNADSLLSSGGPNILIGLGGDDLYYVNNSGDTVTETVGGGFDTVVAGADYALPAEIEALYMNGTGLTGTGSGGADTLLSIGGANILVGLGGDDIYHVNSSGDTVTETGGAGYDIVAATVDYLLPANVEALYMIGADLTGIGSGNADSLLSSGGPNTLIGLGGDDLYYVNNPDDVVTEAANDGYDTVMASVSYNLPANVEAMYMNGSGLIGTGSSGADTLATLGANTLVGDDGNDMFVLFAGSANGATVADFDQSEGDVLVFSGFGTGAQVGTFTPIGANQWQLHSGLDFHNETITLANGAAVQAGDFFFV